MIRWSPIVPVAAAVALAAPAVRAQNPTEEARAAFQEGVREYAARRYAQALEAFRRAYRVRPHPSVLVNIANCYAALNQPQQAIGSFERYLTDQGANVTPAQRDEIQRAIAEQRRQLATITILARPPGAEIFVDGDLVGIAPLRRPLQLGAGPHVVEARLRGGASLQHQARVDAGGMLTVTLDLPAGRSYVGTEPPPDAIDVALRPPTAPNAAITVPGPTAPVVTPETGPSAPLPPVVTPGNGDGVTPVVVTGPSDRVPRRRGGVPGAVYGGLVVTLAATGVAIGFGVYTLQLRSDYDDAVLQFNAATEPDLRTYYQQRGLAIADAVDDNRLVANIATGVAVVGGLFTLGSLIWWPRGSARVARHVQVLPSLDGRGVTLGGAF